MESEKYYFNQDNPHFSAFRALSSPVIGCYIEKRQFVGFENDDADLETYKVHSFIHSFIYFVTADAWSDHYWQPHPCRQAQGKVRQRPVDVFLWQLFL